MKKITILLIILILIFATYVIAAPIDYEPGSDTSVDVSEVAKLGGIIVGSIQAIGVIVAITVLIYMGIRLMMSSPSEKANIKGMAIPYIVGAIIIFATTTLVNIIYNLASGIK